MYKKSEKMRVIRRALESGKLLGPAIREAGIKSYYTISLWRKRPLIDRYFQKCIKRMEVRRIDTVVDALYKQAISGHVAAICFFLKNKAGWKDAPVFEQHNHVIYQWSRNGEHNGDGKSKGNYHKLLSSRVSTPDAQSSSAVQSN